MAEQLSILFVSNDTEKQHRIRDILEFIDYPAVKVCRFTDLADHINDIQHSVIILDGDNEDLQYQEICQTIQGASYHPEMGENTLIITLSSSKNRSLLARADASLIFAQLDYPVKYPQLSDALDRAQMYQSASASGSGRSPELFRSLVGSSRAITRVRKLIEQVADSEATVLILGESGTGKEVVARNLHYHSTRKTSPFVPVNCGAIPADLLESELFGHEKGAFTGAITARQGRFEIADGGTLFLDEIGDMSLPMQVKLLRVLQERTFERVGSNKILQANVRIVAATHRNLEDNIKEGKFREDLFYRLNVFPIEMPPLRDRMEDIPLLINELVSRLENQKRGSVRLTPAAIMSLCQYRWPGNVRELANLVERLVIIYPYGVVDVSDLPEKFRITKGGVEENDDRPDFSDRTFETMMASLPPVASRQPAEQLLPKDGLDLKVHLAEIECSLIQQALDQADGVVARAAKLLTMRRTTLVEKMRKYGLQRCEDAS